MDDRLIICGFCGRSIRTDKVIYIEGNAYHESCAKLKALEIKVKGRLEH